MYNFWAFPERRDEVWGTNIPVRLAFHLFVHFYQNGVVLQKKKKNHHHLKFPHFWPKNLAELI